VKIHVTNHRLIQMGVDLINQGKPKVLLLRLRPSPPSLGTKHFLNHRDDLLLLPAIYLPEISLATN